MDTKSLAEKLVVELVGIIEKAASDLARERLAALVSEMVPARAPVEEKPAARRGGIPSRRICPIDGCTELGAPRYHQLCPAHRGVPEAEWQAAVAAAKAEGGKWTVEGQKAARKAKKATKAAQAA